MLTQSRDSEQSTRLVQRHQAKLWHHQQGSWNKTAMTTAPAMMQSELARVASFKKAKKYSRRSSIQGSRDWPHPRNGDFAATPETLAEAGFYHDPYALYPVSLECQISMVYVSHFILSRTMLHAFFAKKNMPNGSTMTIHMRFTSRFLPSVHGPWCDVH